MHSIESRGQTDAEGPPFLLKAANGSVKEVDDCPAQVNCFLKSLARNVCTVSEARFNCDTYRAKV